MTMIPTMVLKFSGCCWTSHKLFLSQVKVELAQLLNFCIAARDDDDFGGGDDGDDDDGGDDDDDDCKTATWVHDCRPIILSAHVCP